jgi:hypothetical protein
MHLQSQTYTQRPHCCADQTIAPVLTLSLHDGGGGWYVVLDATAWALDDTEEIQSLAEAAKALLAQAPEEWLSNAE